MRTVRTLASAAGVAAAALAAAPAVHAQTGQVPRETAISKDGPGGRHLLAGPWLFRIDHEDQGLGLRLQSQPDTAGWTQVAVPHAWNAGDDSPESQRGSVGWYRKDFVAPKGGGPWTIRFESVNYRATVWVNGKEVGEHEGASIPFEVTTGTLSSTTPNRLVIRVDSRRADTDLPPLVESSVTGLPGGGWWNYGGLLREVYLRRTGDVDVASVQAMTQLECRRCDAEVTVRARLRNITGRRQSADVRGRIGSATVDFGSQSVPAGSSKVVKEQIEVSNPRLWEPGRPRLTRVRISTTRGGRALSTWAGRTGLRDVEVNEDGRVEINGRTVRMRGASVHEEDPRLGAALTPGHHERLIAELKELGANITRAHYPLHPHFLELADEAGILVWEQIPFYRFPETAVALTSVREKGLAYLEQMIERDGSHPSVIAWSIANELSRDPGKGQTAYARDAIKLIRDLDPTRLATIDIVGYPSVRLVSLYKEFDALGINAYFGWYPGPSGSVLNRGVLGPYLDQLHEYYPETALFVTEFGAEANRHGPPTEKGTYGYQADLMRHHLATYDAKSFMSGAIVWILRDFKVRPEWDGGNPAPSPPYNKKGLIDQYGVKKPAFSIAQQMFRGAPSAPAPGAPAPAPGAPAPARGPGR